MRIPFPGGAGWAGGAIRPWRAADAKPLVALADDRKVWINLTDRFPHPYTLGDARRWLKDASMQTPPRDFALECEGALCGGIGMVMGDDLRAGTAEIGYWLGGPFWGRGLATAAVRAFAEYAFGGLGLRRISARVLDWNPASARVLEKCGFVLEGRLRRSALKDGKVADELLYARLPE